MDWQDELRSSFTSIEQLGTAGLVSTTDLIRLQPISERFQLRITPYYARLFQPAGDSDKNSHDPLRLQAIPQIGEEDPVLPAWAAEWSLRAFGRTVPWHPDPIGDLDKLAAPRLTHRYENRALLHCSSFCAMYCRFCFRKSHLNGDENPLYEGDFDPALLYLKNHGEIRELILTGGDPLSMTDSSIRKLFEKLAGISHLRNVRVHSRMAVTLPSRLTDDLKLIFSSTPFVTSLVSHFNHPRELTEYALRKLEAFRKAGIPLYNQSVLLRDVNDSGPTLLRLFQTLYENGVTPFYLHHSDWTPGTFHFRVPISKGRKLLHWLAGRLSGPALPDYVLDIPGGHGKVSLLGTAVSELTSRQDSLVSGALYTVSAPHTRATTSDVRTTSEPRLYLDLWKSYSDADTCFSWPLA